MPALEAPEPTLLSWARDWHSRLGILPVQEDVGMAVGQAAQASPRLLLE